VHACSIRFALLGSSQLWFSLHKASSKPAFITRPSISQSFMNHQNEKQGENAINAMPIKSTSRI